MRIDTQVLEEALDSQSVSKSELARRSGLSRTAIHEIFRAAGKRVRRETVDRLAKALGVPAQRLLLGGVRQSYLGWVADQHARVDFHGLGLGGLPAMALRQLYVPARLSPDPFPSPDLHRGSELPGVSSRPAEVGCGPVSCEEVMRQYDRVLLLGEPGSGKTTLLRHLAVTALEGEPGRSPACTPILLRVAEFGRAQAVDGRLDPIQFLAARVREAGLPDPERDLRRCLQQGNCLVLLDGLDEVVEGGSESPCRQELRELLARFPNNRFVLTARFAGFDCQPWVRLGFRLFHLTAWQGDQIRAFVHRWYSIGIRGGSRRMQAEAQRRAGQLCRAIQTNARLRAIAGSPLMLSVLVAVHQGGGVLPRRRVDLYGKIAHALLESWEAAKYAARPGDLLHGTTLDGREYGWLLEELARQMQANRLTVVPRWWLVDLVQNFLHEQLGFSVPEAKQEYDRVIRYLEERSGLVVQRGPGWYAFWHLTFQEYFAARAIVHGTAADPSGVLIERLRPHLYDPRWAEVIRLVASQLTPAQAPALLEAIVDDPDPAGRFLHRGPLLALRCLADGAPAAGQRLLERVFGSLLDLGRSRWLGITFEALHLLQGFAGTRLAARAQATAEQLLAEARRHLSAEEFLQLRTVADVRLHKQLVEAVARHTPAELQVGSAVTIQCDDGPVTHHFLDPQARANRPEQWFARAGQLLLERNVNERFQRLLVAEMASALRSAPAALSTLTHALKHAPRPGVREHCAHRLQEVAAEEPAVAAILVDHFFHDPDERVRRACGLALAPVVRGDQQLRRQMVELLGSETSAMVRAGAVLGLGQVVESDPSARRTACDVLACEDEDGLLRAACVLALEPCLGHDEATTQQMIELVQRPSPSARLVQYAAGALARALVRGELAWREELVKQVERVLIESPRPGHPELTTLRELVAAREIRAGNPR